MCYTINIRFNTSLVRILQSVAVRDCGPLWSSSTFVFESSNHFLHKMFHGTQHVPKQMVELFLKGKRIVKGMY